MSTVEALTKIAGDMGLTATEAVDLAQEALPQARLEAKVIEAARRWAAPVEADESDCHLHRYLREAVEALDALREGE